MWDVVLVYVGVVLLKWFWEAADWMEEQRNGDGVRGLVARYWLSHRLALLQKGILHVPLCIGWANGVLTPWINEAVQWAHTTVAPDPGIATVPPSLISGVTWLTTIPAAPILDTVGKPIAKRLASIAKALTFTRGSADPPTGGGS